MTYFDGDSITLDNPAAQAPAGLTMNVSGRVTNSTPEAALNVSVDCVVHVDTFERHVETQHLRLPLLAGGAEEVDYSIRLEGDELQAALSALTENGRCVALAVTTRYDSVESVQWTTSATFELRCKSGDRRRRLNALRSGTDDFEELWKNDAAVALDVDVKRGSWRHRKA